MDSRRTLGVLYAICPRGGRSTILVGGAHLAPRYPCFDCKNRRVAPDSVIVECSGLGGGDLNLATNNRCMFPPWHCLRKVCVFLTSPRFTSPGWDLQSLCKSSWYYTTMLRIVRPAGLISSKSGFLKSGGHRQDGSATWQGTSTAGYMPRRIDELPTPVGLGR